MKRSRLTSYLGMISLGLAITPEIILYIAKPDFGNITLGVLFFGMLFGFIITPSIISAYFELQTSKSRFGPLGYYNTSWNSHKPKEREPVGKIASLFYGLAFLLLGFIMPFYSFENLGWLSIVQMVLWIICGILGIIGAIIYRDSAQKRSFDEKIKKRKIGFVMVVIWITFFLTVVLILNTTTLYYRTLYVKQDAYINQSYPDSNYGQDHQIYLGNYEYGKTEAFYRFDISGSSNGWREAYLEVRFGFASYPVNVGVCLIYDSWDEMSITWSNKPNHTAQLGHIVCDGFDFHVPVKPKHFINNEITICLYGIGGESDGYLLGTSKEGASSDEDVPLVYLEYKGIDPNYYIGYITAYIVLFAVAILYLKYAGRFSYSQTPPRFPIPIGKKNAFGPDWIKANIAVKKNVVNPDWIKAKINEYNKYKSPTLLEKKINQYISLKLEHGRTYIYVNGRRFLQCMRLVLDIPKKDVRLYDEIESIDEVADLYDKHLYQNRIVTGPMARPVLDQTHDITPEQEFWGHCSNIQAWVEHDYDTRILKSNVSFPLLRELTQAGDPLARKVFREEIALRLESGYPSVVQYLLNQGYIRYLTPLEFKTILETTQLIKNISREPKVLYSFLSSCALKFPNLFKDILLKILMLSDGRNNIISSLSAKSKSPYFIYKPQFLIPLYQALEDLLGRVEFQLKKYVIDCISVTGKLIEKGLSSPPLPDIYQKLINAPFNDIMPEIFMHLKDKAKIDNQILHKFYNSQPKCSYCGKIIPKGLYTCHWCGHNLWT